MALSGTFYSRPIGGNDFGLNCKWTATQDPIANTSTVTLKCYLHYYTINVGARNDNICDIGGQITYQDVAAINHYPYAWTERLLYSVTKTVSHASNGTKTCYLQCDYAFNGTYSGTYVGNMSPTTTVTLDTINRTAATLTLTINEVSSDTLYIDCVTNAYCDRWYYKLGSGGTYTLLSSVNSKSCNMQIPNLTPSTAYTIYIKVRRTYNNVETVASKAFETIGVTQLQAVSGGYLTPCDIDAATAVLSLNVFSYDVSYYHSVDVMDGENVLASWTDVQLASVGASVKTLNFTSEHRTAVLEDMYNVKFKNYTIKVYTYTGSGETGLLGFDTMPIRLQTSAANSAPTLSGLEYHDTNSVSTAVTGDNQYIVRGISTVYVSAATNAVRNGANYAGFSCLVGDVYSAGAFYFFEMGTIDNESDTVCSITLYDSRGYSTTVSKAVTVLNHEQPTIEATARRQNNVDNIIQLDVSGSISSLIIGETELNEVQHLFWKYKKTDTETYSAAEYLTETMNGVNYTYETLDLTNSVNTFDVDFSYYLLVSVVDAFGSTAEHVILIPRGTPLISVRRDMIGINKAEPEATLDVVGTVLFNGHTPTILDQKSSLLSKTAAQSLANNTDTVVTFPATVEYGGSGDSSLLNSNTGFVIPSGCSGANLSACIQFAADSSKVGVRRAMMYRNTVDVSAVSMLPTGATDRITLTYSGPVAEEDVFIIKAFQNSGDALELTNKCVFCINLIGVI